MNFRKAMKEIKRGKVVKRKHDSASRLSAVERPANPNGTYRLLEIAHSNGYQGTLSGLTVEDVLASDWEVVS